MDASSSTLVSGSQHAAQVAALSDERDRGGSQRQRLEAMYAPVMTGLDEVDRRIRQELQSQYECLQPLMRHGTQLGGKRLRPALLLLASQAADGEPDEVVHQQLVSVATALELVHTATLVHDDVLDGANRRRHLPTVNAQWGEHASILLGDYLFALAYRLAASAACNDVCVLIGEAARKVCEGELRQVLLRHSLELDEPTYIELIRGKTAELCSVACRLGATLGGATAEIVQSLADFGDALGIAFQIADDYLDLWGDEQDIGKTLGTDLMQGKWTLPIIRLRSMADDTKRQRIDEILLADPISRYALLKPLLDRSDAKFYTRQVAHHYRDLAKQSISQIKQLPVKTALESLADFSVCRTF